MTYEFRFNGSKKLVLNPQNQMEELMFAEIFSGEVEVKTNPQTKEITLIKKEKNEKLAGN